MFFFNKKRTKSPEITSPISHPVNLTKASQNLESSIVRLKKSGVDLSGHKARVFVVVDISGSMGKRFPCEVQNALTRIFPLALKFDDNGEMEVYVFDTQCSLLPEPMTMGNYQDYVENYICSQYQINGGTRYSPFGKQTVSDYNDGSLLPAFGIVITDGEPFSDDVCKTNDEIRKSCKSRVFYQFVGIGRSNFKYLKELDNLDGRAADNAAFIKVSEISDMSDEELYDKLLEQYPSWLRAMHIN